MCLWSIVGISDKSCILPAHLQSAVKVSELEEITALLNKTIERHGLWDT